MSKIEKFWWDEEMLARNPETNKDEQIADIEIEYTFDPEHQHEVHSYTILNEKEEELVPLDRNQAQLIDDWVRNEIERHCDNNYHDLYIEMKEDEREALCDYYYDQDR